MSSICRYVYFFKAPGFSGEHSVMDSGSFRAEIVAVSKIEDVCGILPDMMKEGVDLVELCGSFGPDGAKLVSESIDGAVPVAYVSDFKEIRKKKKAPALRQRVIRKD